MAKKYHLTWRKEQGGRWRKKYKHQEHYFRRLPGESKDESYYRCLKLWEQKKVDIDRQEAEQDPIARGEKRLIEKVEALLRQLESKDTLNNREEWAYWNAQLRNYHEWIEEGAPLVSDDADPEDPPLMIVGSLEAGSSVWNPPDPMDAPPPWADARQAISAKAEPDTLEALSKRFLKHKRRQVESDDLSPGRFDAIRVGLELFSGHCGAMLPIDSINESTLSTFYELLQDRIADGKFARDTAKSRLQVVNQFIDWTWREGILKEKPRNLRSHDFRISVPKQEIQTFSNYELTRLLNASSDRTKLYLLLMLNCGFQQKDIADLLQSEVDWQQGRITRKRSKTGKGKSNNVPTVSYLLWPETFELLCQERSNHLTLALTNQKGEPLKSEPIKPNGRVSKSDNIRCAYARVQRKLKNAKVDPITIDKTLKLLRKTAASMLGEHSDYSRFAGHFLGHAPATVADSHYVRPSESQFDEAIQWLRSEFLQVT